MMALLIVSLVLLSALELLFVAVVCSARHNIDSSERRGSLVGGLIVGIAIIATSLAIGALP